MKIINPITQVKFYYREDRIIRKVAEDIRDGFDQFHTEFKLRTKRAEEFFNTRKWQSIQNLSRKRLDLYKYYVAASVEQTENSLKHKIQDYNLWRKLKANFQELIAGRYDEPIVETFFNSVLRKIFIEHGFIREMEFLGQERRIKYVDPDVPIYDTYYLHNDTMEILLNKVLYRYNFPYNFKKLDILIPRLARNLAKAIKKAFGRFDFDRFEVLRPVFYRNKGAYVVGRVIKGNRVMPVIIPFIHPETGVEVDNVLFTYDQTSVVFSFTRSYFLVYAENPAEIILFLRPLMPHKVISELYSSIGYNRHSKTILYREMFEYLDKHPKEKFDYAPGIPGMVMTVFTLPFFNMVFKVIKDNFKAPKTVTREHVVKSYRLVFMHDRVGRLADALEFEYLIFDKSRFCNELLEELTTRASETVKISGDKVVITQVFTERKMIPMNLYLADNSYPDELKRKVVIDYGQAVKDLATANIFPGDLLMKNFGVTRQGRVVFYDYDELCFLKDCNFRRIPPTRNIEQEYEADPYFTVGENDIFPEKLRAFMIPAPGTLRNVFLKRHDDLFDVEYWKKMQYLMANDSLEDVFPYDRLE